MKNHEKYIQRCITLAKKGLGKTYPNPMVGSVIVHQGKIIGEGYHQKAGEPHAEINAINSVKNKDLLKESTIYVSLEPCAHFGKTPPCALKLKEIGFKKVVIGTSDSHDKVNGKGVEILQSHGNIEILQNVLKDECRAINKRFFTFHEKKRPFIILKWAESADEFLDQNFQPTKISNALASQMVHQMRAEEHAILVGTKTALTDNPSLTVRLVAGENPIRVLIDLDLKVPPHFKIYNDKAKTLVFNSVKNEINNSIEFIQIDKENFLSELMKNLYERNIQSIIIEGGSYTLQEFINENLWDEICIIRNPNLHLKNGTKAPKINLTPTEIKQVRDNEILKFFK